MRLFGLIGYPLSHSFSKSFFAAKFNEEGIADCEYRNFPIENISGFKALFQNEPSLEGINVTIPYKEQVIPFLDWKSEVVEHIGACNCIRRVNNKLYGYNTDTTGFEQSLRKFLMPHHKRALVLGTGGAAKAIGFVLEKLRIDYLYVTRSGNIPSGNTIGYNDVTPGLLASHTLLINSTPLGMFPNIENAPALDYNLIDSRHYLFDLVYNPERTLFLKKGEERGAAVQNGYDMLIIQAEESWKIWNTPEG